MAMRLNKLQADLALIKQALRQRGPRFLFDYMIEAMLWDWRYKTDTHRRVPKPVVTSETPEEELDGVLYVSSFTSVVRETIRLAEEFLGNERFRRAQFVDIGCGKGKALLVYAHRSRHTMLCPATGIEYHAGLAKTAQDNVQKMGFTKRQVTIVCDSATSILQHVYSDELIVYLYNPFRGRTLQSTLEKIAAIPHILIYVDPAESEQLSAFGYRMIGSRQGRYHADTWVVASSRGLERTQR